MWVLLWVILSANGTMTSGSAEFEDKMTCEAAAVNMETLATTVQAATAPSARFLGRCLPKRAK